MTVATAQFPSCQSFAPSGTLGTVRQTSMNLNRKPIYLLAAELTKLKARAKALGVFTNERELLACPRCRLVEDVTCDGLLITYMSSALEQDSGLRFEATSNNQFRCPACGSITREKSTRTRLPNKTRLRRTAAGHSKTRQ